MADLTWPPALPQEPFANGDVVYTPNDNILATQMEAGAAKRRPKATAVAEMLAVTLHLSATRLAVLMDFRRRAGVSLSFNWIDFTTMTPAEYRFASMITRRFLGPDDQTGEFWWEATFTLELQP